MKELIPILILLSITFQSIAQTDSCGTPDAVTFVNTCNNTVVTKATNGNVTILRLQTQMVL